MPKRVFDAILFLVFLAIAATGGLVGWNLHTQHDITSAQHDTISSPAITVAAPIPVQSLDPQPCAPKDLSRCLAAVAGPNYHIVINGSMGYMVVPKNYAPPMTSVEEGRMAPEREQELHANDHPAQVCC